MGDERPRIVFLVANGQLAYRRRDNGGCRDNCLGLFIPLIFYFLSSYHIARANFMILYLARGPWLVLSNSVAYTHAHLLQVLYI